MTLSLLLSDSFSSFARVIVGVLFGSILGVCLAGARYFLIPKKFQNNILIQFFFDFIKYPPPIAWIPFVIIFCGIGNLSSIIIVVIGVMPPMQSQIYDGLLRTPQIVLDTCQNMGLSSFQMLRWIYPKMLLPEFFTGLKISLGMGWMVIIAAEMISGSDGLGNSIQMYRFSLDYEKLLLNILTIGIIGMLLQKILLWSEKKILQGRNKE